MLEKIPFDLIGLTAFVPIDYAHLFVIRGHEYQRRKNKLVKVETEIQYGQLYPELGKIAVGFGLIQHLINTGQQQFILTSKTSQFDVHELQIPGAIELRDYQSASLQAIRWARVGLVEASVAAGKTEIFLTAAESESKHYRVVIIVPNDTLRRNVFQRVEKYNNFLQVAHYRDSRDGDSSQILVSTGIDIVNDIESGQNTEVLNTIGCLLVDEADLFTDQRWQRLLMLRNLTRCLGFTATAYSSERRNQSNNIRDFDYEKTSVIAACGDIKYKLSIEQIREYITIPELICVPFRWQSNKLRSQNNWRIIYKAMVNNTTRNQMIAGIIDDLERLDLTTVTPLSTKKHAQEIGRHCKYATVCYWYGGGEIWFEGHRITPERAFEQAESGVIRHIIATPHLNRGFNCPELEVAIMVEGRKEKIVKQRSGRIVRRYEGKRSFIINIMDEGQNILGFHGKQRRDVLATTYQITSTTITSDQLPQLLTDRLTR